MCGKQNKKLKYALITGVSSGFGKALAHEFAARGFFVAGVSRSEPADKSDLALWIHADLTQESGRAKIAEEIRRFAPAGLDVLINNAGMGLYAAWDEMREEDLRAVFELDFFAPVLLTKSLLPDLKTAGGTVINISSAAARIWVPCMGAYCAVKAALSMFSNSLRPELEASGVRVLDVAPGQVNTGFSSRSRGERKPPDSPGSSSTSPAGLAAAVYKAWKRRKKRITYPRTLSAAIGFVRTLLPNLYDRINQKLWKL